MNTTTATSSAIEGRIRAEQQRLLIEQNIERDLEGQRLAPLEAGDDDALDQIEAGINASRDRQLRIQERIELLERRLADAQDREADRYIDQLREQADAERERGLRLIRSDYVRQARALAKTLHELALIDRRITEVNREISAAGRDDLVDSPNETRNRPTEYETVTVRRRVGIGQPEHPGHNKRRPVSSDGHLMDNPRSPTVHFADGTSMPRYMEVDVPERQCIEGVRQGPLWDVIRLPRPGLEGDDIWDGPTAEIGNASDISAEGSE